MPYTKGSTRIYYEVYGEGPPLVLIHANPFDHRLWTYQIQTFSQMYRTIAVDIRGYGRSDKPETPFSLRDMVDDVLEACAQENVTRAIFAGVSVGSGMALLIGLDQPEMVDAVVLVGGSSGGATDVAGRVNGYAAGMPDYHLKHMTELFAPGFLETTTGRWVKKIFTDTSSNLSGKCIGEIFKARAGCDMSQRLADFKPPALVINGAFDGSLTAGRFTAAHIPGAQHFVLPDTGHACNIEDPATFDARMTQFLSETSLLPA